ncbi:endonuclease domain-containing protein [Actinomadura sp. KC216]|uniref:endonuclease domain-containing protein n=1 Tax=Actinomadura sp. KC216 TaxID=2530370 RepID=UPI001FB85D95|nr:endonuclease domain-containing protein [Actinomadura sp. KC216]
MAGEYDQLFKAQGGVCAGCLQPRTQRLSVDHDHKSQLVRGLLCRRCNGHVLPYSKDSPETLRRLADYLENPPALRILGKRYYQGEDKSKRKRKKRNVVR